MDQIAIALTGVVAIFLSQDESANRRKYACLFGLASQPFWFYSAYTAGQRGVLVLSAFYTMGWARGVYNNWVK